MSKIFKVKIADNTERAEVFMRIFGRTEVCVTSPNPVLVGVEGFDEPQACYWLDIQDCSNEELRQLLDYLGEKYGYSRMDVRDRIVWGNGVPIFAADCTLIVSERLAKK